MRTSIKMPFQCYVLQITWITFQYHTKYFLSHPSIYLDFQLLLQLEMVDRQLRQRRTIAGSCENAIHLGSFAAQIFECASGDVGLLGLTENRTRLKRVLVRLKNGG